MRTDAVLRHGSFTLLQRFGSKMGRPAVFLNLPPHSRRHPQERTAAIGGFAGLVRAGRCAGECTLAWTAIPLRFDDYARPRCYRAAGAFFVLRRHAQLKPRTTGAPRCACFSKPQSVGALA
jgi:hypothetical protein